MTEWTAHCGCKITMSDEDGEPVEFVSRCEAHAEPAVVTDVSGENRAMTLARMAVSELSGQSVDSILAEIVGDDRHAHAELGAVSADVPKVSLGEYIANHPKAVSFARKV